MYKNIRLWYFFSAGHWLEAGVGEGDPYIVNPHARHEHHPCFELHQRDRRKHRQPNNTREKKIAPFCGVFLPPDALKNNFDTQKSSRTIPHRVNVRDDLFSFNIVLYERDENKISRLTWWRLRSEGPSEQRALLRRVLEGPAEGRCMG